ncbi:hypothetical protein OPV22_009446 [Ensete ventricosum]|uniref:Uncharacterized protein n=1 Tax=Ensete ventricosum TaxID=4639 RepID=A0AAV8PSM8_ENSVE|nr:hypothetical protein OPV22_009446 [Ensete ventricosum]
MQPLTRILMISPTVAIEEETRSIQTSASISITDELQTNDQLLQAMASSKLDYEELSELGTLEGLGKQQFFWWA